MKAVAYMTQQDFGTLTMNINQLYARYQFGIEPEVAWDKFCWETNSNLIQKYTRLFVEATAIGGSPHEISKFVSENVEKILELRKDKGQVIDSLRGTLTPSIFIIAALMVFMNQTLDLLGSVLGASGDTDLGSLAGTGSPPSDLVLAIYFGGLIFLLPFFSGLAITLPKQTHISTSTGFMSKSYIILGFEIYLMQFLVEMFFSDFGLF